MLISAYRNGATAGSPPPPRDHSRDVKRGRIVGWSRDAVRRHVKWLYSVDADALTGSGWAATLTLRDCPVNSEAWVRVLRAFVKRIERSGALRLHWVVEWQRRGVPHLHTAIYWPEGIDQTAAVSIVLGAWLDVAREYSPGWRSQDVNAIDGALGWLQYLSKHAARGVAHYQRQGKPEGWETTGRLWGHRGEWPTSDPMRFDVAGPTYHRFRRMVRSWRVADARAALGAALAAPTPVDRDARERHAERVATARRRLVSARRMLRCGESRLSAVRGVSEWISEDVASSLLLLLAAQGHPVVQRSEVPDAG